MKKTGFLLVLLVVFSCGKRDNEKYCHCVEQDYTRYRTQSLANGNTITIDTTDWVKNGKARVLDNSDCKQNGNTSNISNKIIKYDAKKKIVELIEYITKTECSEVNLRE